MASVLRPGVVDMSTPDGRSRERYRRVALAAAASAAARAISIGAALLTVPLALRYLGPERYGLWVTISSAVAMLAFADFGLNNGLVTAIADASGRDDRDAARAAVSSALAMLMGVAAALLVAFVVAYPLVPWARVFNVTSPAAIAEAGPTVAVFLGCFLVSLPLTVVQRVQMGYQELFAASVWQAVGSLFGLAGLVAAVLARAALPWLVLALVGAPALAALLNSVLFWRGRPWLRPQLAAVSPAAVRGLAVSGGLFFALQVAGALSYQSDNLVISHYLGAAAVAEFSVPMKLFSMLPVLLSFVLTPLWPAYSEAIARRDVAWVRRTFQRVLLFTVAVVVPAAVALTVFGRPIVRLWVGESVAPPSTLLLVGLGAWAVVNGVSGCFAVLLNGAGVIGFQVVTAGVMTLVNVGLSIALVQRLGVAGPVLGSVVSVLICIVAPAVFYVPRLLATWSSHPPTRASLT